MEENKEKKVIITFQVEAKVISDFMNEIRKHHSNGWGLKTSEAIRLLIDEYMKKNTNNRKENK